MTSEKKIAANRRNALQSTGPKTPEGKATARLNATRHGLLSKEVLLPDEDAEAFRELAENLRAELRPVGELENLLVDRIIGAYWRLRRLGRIEVGIFAWERSEQFAERAEREAQQYEDSDSDAGFFGPEIVVTDSEKHEEALSRARSIRSAQEEDETATMGRTFARDANGANAFSKLSRYETAIDRQFRGALHELERRQAVRQGGDVTVPHIVDVDVSGITGGND